VAGSSADGGVVGGGVVGGRIAPARVAPSALPAGPAVGGEAGLEACGAGGGGAWRLGGEESSEGFDWLAQVGRPWWRLDKAYEQTLGLRSANLNPVQ
jgi:hypothetical protein